MPGARKEFQLIKKCQKLCMDILEMQGVADRRYRYTICKDLREMSETVVHLVRKANSLPSGTEERIAMQEQADNLLEDIKDLIGIAGKLLNTGERKEAQIVLSIEALQGPLKNWMETDRKKSVSVYEKQVRMLGWELYRAKKTAAMVKEYYEKHPDDRTATACDEAQSRYRIAGGAYREAVEKYDRAVRQLRGMQERYHKDDSVLAEVLAEMKTSGIDMKDLRVVDPPLPEAVREKKQEIQKIHRRILETDGKYFSRSTIRFLRGEEN